MRKRGQTRPATNADDMWFTAPPGKKEEPEAAPTTRSDEPTYEDTWYRILSSREDGAPDAADETPTGEPEPAGT